MKNLFLLSFLLFTSVVTGQTKVQEWESMQREKIGQVLPVFTTVSLDNDTLVTNQLEGKVVVYNFWSAACPPCRAKFKFLDSDLYQKFKDNPDVEFISVTTEKQRGALPIVEKYEMSHPVYMITNEEMKRLVTIDVYPTTLITDRDGNIVLFKRGGSTEEKWVKYEVEQLVQKIEEILNQ